MPNEVQTTIQTALAKLQSEKVRIDRQISALQAALATFNNPLQGNGAPPGSRRKMSPAARKLIAKRMKAYSAKRRARAKAPTKVNKG